MEKCTMKSLLIFLLFLTTSCSGIKERYYQQGYSQGHSIGVEKGRNEGYAQFASNHFKKAEASKLIFKNSSLNIPPNSIVKAIKEAEKNPLLFEKTVFQIDSALFENIASSLELNATAKNEVRAKISQAYPQLASSVREQYVSKIKTISNSSVSFTEITRNTTNAKIFSEVLASNLCSFSTLILIPMKVNLSIVKDEALGYITQDPCTSILSGLLEPLSKRIIKAAMIQDIVETRHNIELVSLKAIAELATAQATFTDRGSKDASRINAGWFKSKGTLSMEFQGIYKAGFDLSGKLKIQVNHSQKSIDIYISKPKLFPPSITPKITGLDEGWGWVKDIGPEHYDLLFQECKQKLTYQAEVSDLKSKALKNAEFIIKQMYLPFLSNPDFEYTINVISR